MRKLSKEEKKILLSKRITIITTFLALMEELNFPFVSQRLKKELASLIADYGLEIHDKSKPRKRERKYD